MINRRILRGGAAAGSVAAALGVAAVAGTAAVPSYERALAGIRLSSSAKNVLARYGNPNDIVIGDQGVRGVGASGTAGLPQQQNQQGGYPGGYQGGGPPPDGAGSSSLPPLGFGGQGGPPPGFAPPPGYGGAGQNREEGVTFPGAGGGGPTVGAFGQTSSSVTQQQEVTWVYNRRSKDKNGADQLVTYEFLVGPTGNISQIRATGYTGGGIRTSRGVQLGTTYRDVVRIYGYPESHAIYANTLVASYRNRAHVQFQFLNDRVLRTNVINPGNKVIGITVATIE